MTDDLGETDLGRSSKYGEAGRRQAKYI
jgi:hypothetical protein